MVWVIGLLSSDLSWYLIGCVCFQLWGLSSVIDVFIVGLMMFWIGWLFLMVSVVSLCKLFSKIMVSGIFSGGRLVCWNLGLVLSLISRLVSCFMLWCWMG